MRTSKIVSFAIVGIIAMASVAQAQFGKALPLLPDPKITPGDTLPVTKDDICVPGYAKKVRDVPKEVKDQAYANYGIKSHKAGDFEVDHLISLELGGSNSIKNLWPESFKTKPWNARVKDKLENELHREVCNGEIELTVAQKAIASNWIKAYQKYVGKGKSTGAGTGTRKRSRRTRVSTAKKPVRTATRHRATGKVWLNTRTGVYWRPGSRYYGKTVAGKYIAENVAISQGYHAANSASQLVRAGN